MLIVEGPDGAGKTTLVKNLSQVTGWPVAPRVVDTKTNSLTDLKKWVQTNVTSHTHPDQIFDRHRLISEPIYGTLLRPESPEPGFDDVVWLSQMFQRFYNWCRPVIIYCLPPLEVVRANILEGETDNSAVAGIIDAMYSLYRYRASLDMALGYGLLYDYTEPGTKDLLMDYIVHNVVTRRG